MYYFLSLHINARIICSLQNCTQRIKKKEKEENINKKIQNTQKAQSKND